MNKKPQFVFSEAKSKKLKEERGISFEEIITAIETGHLLEFKTQHPNQKKYPHQQVLVVELNNYAYLVPCVRDGDTFFLKTAYPSRKATGTFLKNKPTGEKT